MADWRAAARDALAEGPAALVTVLATEGSAPRGPGARMVVTESGIAGTIGGGALEHQASAQARAILAHPPGSWRVQDWPLGPMLGQCCGGRVRLLVERLAEVPAETEPYLLKLGDRIDRSPFPEANRSLPVSPSPSGEGLGWGLATSTSVSVRRNSPTPNPSPEGEGLATTQMFARGPLPQPGDSFLEPSEAPRLGVTMFGAGHVGRAIAERARGLPLHLGWFDPRAELADCPGVVTADEDSMAACAAALEPGSAAVILTHDHALDYRLTAAALRSDAGYVGLIGSRTKRARFVSRLADEGIDSARLTCPIGMASVHGKQPEVIAIAVLAELLSLPRPA